VVTAPRLLLTLALALSASFSACAKTEPAPPGLAIEPLPADGRPPPAFEAMLFGGTRGCRENTDCESNVCSFNTCVGLVTADELWRLEKIGLRVRERLALQPELRPLVTSLLVSVVAREEMGFAFRGRAVRALGELVQVDGPAVQASQSLARPAVQASPSPPMPVPSPPTEIAAVVAELVLLLRNQPASIAEVAALTLARLGDATGLDIVLALTESPRLASACEALRLVGSGARGGTLEMKTEALTRLLATLSPDVDLELQRAAISGLGTLGDPRAIRPLAAHLVTGPEALADEVAASLRALSGQSLGPDTLAWDAWVASASPPAPPPYTLRGHNSLDDIDLPTP